MRARVLKTCGTWVAAALVATACGGEDDGHANAARPPSPITVTAAITDAGVSVSPRRFGAGPIVLVVSNQTDRARSVTFETDEIAGEGPGIRQTTSPINPSGTASLQLDVRRGTYRLGTGGRRPPPASLRVGARRASAQDELLQP